MKTIFQIISLFLLVTITKAQWEFKEIQNGYITSPISVNNILFSLSNHVLFVSTDNGYSWEIHNNQPPISVGKICQYENILYAIGDTLYRSSDNGNNWEIIDNGINNIRILDVTGFNDTLYAKSETKIFISIDNGLSWELMAENIWGHQILVNNTAVFVASAGGGLFWSIDRCKTWQNQMFGMSTCIVQSAIISGDNILVGCSSTYNPRGGNQYLTFKHYLTGAFLQVYGDISRAFLSFDKYLLMVTRSKVLRSIDMGETWQNFDNGIIEVNNDPYNFFSAGINSEYLFVCGSYTSSNRFGIWRRSVSEITGIQSKNYIGEISSIYKLSQNYPNPFNPTTTIEYEIPKRSYVIVGIFNVLGKSIETLVNQEQASGKYNITFDASRLSSGIYFYSLHTNGFIQTRKMILIR